MKLQQFLVQKGYVNNESETNAFLDQLPGADDQKNKLSEYLNKDIDKPGQQLLDNLVQLKNQPSENPQEKKLDQKSNGLMDAAYQSGALAGAEAAAVYGNGFEAGFAQAVNAFFHTKASVISNNLVNQVKRIKEQQSYKPQIIEAKVLDFSSSNDTTSVIAELFGSSSDQKSLPQGE